MDCILIPLWVIITALIIYAVLSIIYLRYTSMPTDDNITNFKFGCMIFAMGGVGFGGLLLCLGFMYIVTKLIELLPCIRVV
jgi:hypothetical protein